MKDFIKKIYVAVNLLLVLSTGDAFADCETNMSDECHACQACQPACCGHTFVGVEFLYWRAFENGLDTCVPSQVSDTILPDGSIVSTFRGRGRDPHFNWDPGVRIGVGYESPCKQWALGAFWTHLNTRAHGGGGHHTHWKLDFDELDIAAGYGVDFGYCLTLTPFIGLRGAKIDQRLRFKESSGSSGSSSFPVDLTSLNRRNKEEFLGLGPLVGLEADFNMGCGLSLYANGAFSWMYGRFHVHFKEEAVTVDTTNISRIKNRLDASLASADVGIGIRWKTIIYNKYVMVQLGLEHHRYFDYNRFGDYGDLSFDGINLGAAVEF